MTTPTTLAITVLLPADPQAARPVIELTAIQMTAFFSLRAAAKLIAEYVLPDMSDLISLTECHCARVPMVPVGATGRHDVTNQSDKPGQVLGVVGVIAGLVAGAFTAETARSSP